jgi:hypothetical protein
MLDCFAFSAVATKVRPFPRRAINAILQVSLTLANGSMRYSLAGAISGRPGIRSLPSLLPGVAEGTQHHL